MSAGWVGVRRRLLELPEGAREHIAAHRADRRRARFARTPPTLGKRSGIDGWRYLGLPVCGPRPPRPKNDVAEGGRMTTAEGPQTLAPPKLIVVLDTNALHDDVYLVRQPITTLFEASDQGLLEGMEIWTPFGVVEELVRQFPERVERMKKVLRAIGHDLNAFGFRVDLPGSDAQQAYRKLLTEKLTGPHRRIADHPADGAKVISWAAAHRFPIKVHELLPKPRRDEADLRHFAKPKTRPVFGVVDAGIWLTVIEAARQAPVALITDNSGDFSDSDDHHRVGPLFAKELESAGINPDKVEIFKGPTELNERYVDPATDAQQAFEDFLAEEANLEALKTEISDASEWFGASFDEEFQAGVEIDDATLQSFDVAEVALVRADPAPDGVWATVEATGEGRVDLGIRKGEAIHLPDDSPITVYDWDWNESMVAAEAELPVWALVEVRLDSAGDLAVSIDETRIG
jgi:hypothetical protein